MRVTATPLFDDDSSLVGLVVLLRDVTEVRETTARLATSQRRFQALIESSGDLFAITDAEGAITFLDGPAQALLGVEADALVGTSLFELVRPGDLRRAQALWAERVSATTPPIPPNDYWVQPADRSWVCLSLLVSNLLDDPDVGGIVVTARDVTARKNLEQARAAIKGTNVALVHAASEDDLFNKICRVVVNETRYHFAWIGLSDPDQPLGVRVTAFGDSPAYFDALEHLAGKGTYRGPLLMALETHEVQVVQDIAALPETMPWRRLALDYGYRSAVALPLFFSEDEQGVLAIYSEDPNVFSDEAVDVLSELANDLAFGIDALRPEPNAPPTGPGSRPAWKRSCGRSPPQRSYAIPTPPAINARWQSSPRLSPPTWAWAPQLVAGIRVAASIHDIGKLAVPAEILSRPGRVSEAEFTIIKSHAQAGHDVVVGIDFPWPVAEMILQHHERLDGSGYPAGLHGEDISIGARIIAVADTVEAMHSHRPYRPGLGTETALRTIAAGRGTLFDPEVVDSCARLFGQQGFCFTL